MANYVIIDGSVLSRDAATVSALAPGLTTGMGVFTTMLAVDGEVRHMLRHYQRLESNAIQLGLKVPAATTLIRWSGELLNRNSLANSRARVRVSVYEGNAGASVVIVSAESAPEPAESAKVMVSGYVRNERSQLAGVKCTSYAENLVALRAAREAGADEVLFVDTWGFVSEGATSNVFLVMEDGVVVTPPLASGCLPGVMRSVVIARLGAAGVTCEERNLPATDLPTVSGAFLTSSIRGVQPIAELNGESLDLAKVESAVRAARGE